MVARRHGPGRAADRTALAVLVLGGVSLRSDAAAAGDALRERTPIVHIDETCLTVIDRQATPIVHLDYSFPVEDTCAGSFPAPTHQFLALCRPPAPGEALPQWITSADVAAAEALQIPLFPREPGDVLAESEVWSDCWGRVTGDDERAALTCEVARGGVDWDVSAVTPGAHVIAGYTYQPPRHLWSPRWGVFKICAGPDPDDAPPVAALAQREAFVYADQTIDLPVCVSAMPGSSLRLEYARHDDPPTWLPLADVAVTGAIVSVPWMPPPELHGEDVRLRVRVDDPLGRQGTFEAPELLHVLAVPSPTSGDHDPPGEPPDMCRSDAPPEALHCPPLPTTDSETTTTDDTDAAPGCACAQTAARAPWGAGLLLLGRRRRRATGR